MNTIHLILTYVENDPETYVEAFETKSQAIQFVLDGIRKYWDELHWEENIADEDWKDLENEQESARKSLETKDFWKDREGNTYVYKETEINK